MMLKGTPDISKIAAVLIALTIGSTAAYSYVRISALTERVISLETTLASTTALLIGTIEETQANLSATLTAQKESLENQLGSVSDYLNDVSGTVGDLEKLAKTDPELLAKYSKVFFLNENYAPERVVDIDTQYLYNEQNPELIHELVWPKLEDLLEDAKRDDIELYILSAYRSFDEQGALKGAYAVTYGAGTANTFSADQGYSEHQLGTTVDFITTGLGGQLQGFDKTAGYQWLLKNAHKHGFTLSYPANNGYYIFEPWHWRYVGVDLATDLYRDGKHFYDLDQREIDKYLVDIFE
ncbi:MAG: M15 family metallopeptidase [Patescibacteria group bacterium]|nr:M15 family metallopeptidase [Patescibacteria group bacterium]